MAQAHSRCNIMRLMRNRTTSETTPSDARHTSGADTSLDSGVAGDDNMADSSDSDSAAKKEPCAICLGNLRAPIGSPENCDHLFCLDCILEWSKVS